EFQLDYMGGGRPSSLGEEIQDTNDLHLGNLTEKPSLNLFNKVGGFKINLENSVVFLYTDKKHVEEEGVETIPFKIALKIPCVSITVESTTKVASLPFTVSRSMNPGLSHGFWHQHGPGTSIRSPVSACAEDLHLVYRGSNAWKISTGLSC
ncbi:hypothetical protein STEG23_034776, partial [Scotinomys teguina]